MYLQNTYYIIFFLIQKINIHEYYLGNMLAKNLLSEKGLFLQSDLVIMLVFGLKYIFKLKFKRSCGKDFSDGLVVTDATLTVQGAQVHSLVRKLELPHAA